MLAQVGRDLESWKESGITLEMVEKAYCTEEIIESMRIQVRGQHVQHCRPTQRVWSCPCSMHVHSAIWLMLTHVVSNADHEWVHLPSGAYYVLPVQR